MTTGLQTRAPVLICGVLATVLAATIAFYRLADIPIEQWDEARVANNALEMSQSGPSLVTTYLGEPDHYNTKPPLLVWLIAGTIGVLGPTELAVRLPSAVSVTLIGLMVFAACAVWLRRPLAGVIAVVAMFASTALIGLHGVRSADYEALLTLTTTAYVLAGFGVVESDGTTRRRWIALFGLAVLAAFMTKSAQGLIFLPAVAIYAGWRGQLRSILKERLTWIAASFVVLVGVGYVVARELVDPGYVAAVIANDFLGRVSTVIEGHEGGLLFYLRLETAVLAGAVIVGWLTLPAGRRLIAYLAISMVVYLIVITLSATKLNWYLIPIFPLAGICAGLAVQGAVESLTKAIRAPRTLAIAVMVLVAVAGVGAVTVRAVRFLDARYIELSSNPSYQYGIFLRGPVAAAPPASYLIAHPGFGQPQPYFAATQFYATILERSGADVAIQFAVEPLPLGYDKVVVCGPTRDRLAAEGRLGVAILTNANCGLYEYPDALGVD